MPQGLRIINDDGILQVDEVLPVLSIVERIEVTTQAYSPVNGQFGSFFFYDIVDPDPYLAFYATVHTCCRVRFRPSPGTDPNLWRFRIHCQGAAGTPITLYRLSRVPTLGTFGLAVRDASGQLVFSSACRPVRPRAVLTGKVLAYVGGNALGAVYNQTTHTLTDGRSYGILMGLEGFYSVGTRQPGGLQDVNHLGTARAISGGIETAQFVQQYWLRPGTAPFDTFGERRLYSLLAIDVTGY